MCCRLRKIRWVDPHPRVFGELRLGFVPQANPQQQAHSRRFRSCLLMDAV
jgi:hypothetical protein